MPGLCCWHGNQVHLACCAVQGVVLLSERAPLPYCCTGAHMWCCESHTAVQLYCPAAVQTAVLPSSSTNLPCPLLCLYCPHLVVCCVLPVDGDDVILYVWRLVHAVVECELVYLHLRELEGVLLAGVDHSQQHSLLVCSRDAPEHHGAILQGSNKSRREQGRSCRRGRCNPGHQEASTQ
jgi:hypothetical protein